jgi:hypothetical protein
VAVQATLSSQRMVRAGGSCDRQLGEQLVVREKESRWGRENNESNGRQVPMGGPDQAALAGILTA